MVCCYCNEFLLQIIRFLQEEKVMSVKLILIFLSSYIFLICYDGSSIRLYGNY